MVMSPQSFGIYGNNPEIIAMKYSFVSVGLWWIICSQYTFYYLPEPYKKKKIVRDVVLNGFRELLFVWNEVKNIIVIKKYLIAFFIYSSALQTVLLIAAYFGEQEINWPQDEKTIGLIVSILLIQLIAMFGAILTSKLSEKFGNIFTLIILNIFGHFYALTYFITEPNEFYVAAALVGLVMGGIQALSRSTFSKNDPRY